MSAGGGKVSEHAGAAAGARLPSLRRDLALFAVLAVLGTAACYLSIQIPHTNVNIDGRQFFGLIGFALLGRWWLALALAAVLSYFGFHNNLPDWVCFLGNMLFMVPQLVIFRSAQRFWLSRIPGLLSYGLAWFALVVISYEVVVMPAIWLVLGVIENQPLLGSVLSAWQGQPLLFEGIAVGVMSALAMAAYRSHRQQVASRQRYRDLYESVQAGVVEQDASGRIVHANKVAEEILQFSPGEIYGADSDDPRWEAVDKEGRPVPGSRHASMRVLASGEPVHGELMGLYASDPHRMRWLLVNAEPLYTNGGDAPSGVLTTFLDVSEQVNAEREVQRQAEELKTLNEELSSLNQELGATNEELEAQYEELESTHNELRESQADLAGREEQFRLLAGNLPGVVYQCIADEHWTVRYISDYVERLAGYPAEKFYSGEVSMPQLCHPDDLARTEQEYRDAVAAGRPYHLVYRITRADGALRWIEDRGSVVGSGGAQTIEGYLQDVTERKLAEQELVDSHELVQLLSDASFESIFLSDKGVCLGQNATARGMFGYSDAEAIGKMGTEWVVPGDRDRLLHAVLTNQTEPYRATALRKDGSTFPAEIKGRVVQFRGRQIRVTALRDMSAEEQATSALRESEERLELALEGAGLGSWDWDIPGNHVVYSRRWARMLGYTLDEVNALEEPWEQMLHPDDRAEVMARLNAHLRGETVMYESRHRLRCKDGSYIWVLDRGKVIRFDVDGKPLRAAGTQLDITEHVAREEFQASMMETAMDGIWIMDMEGYVVSINKAGAAMLGYLPEEMAGRHISEFDVHDSPADARQRVVQIMKAGKARFDTRHRCKDGSILEIDAVASYLPQGGGRIISFARDVTERRRYEEQLRFQSAILDQISDVVTATDLEGNIIYANQASCAMLGRSREEILGKHVSYYGDDPEAGARQDEVVKVTLEQGGWRGELINFRTDGSRAVLDTRTSLILDENGEPVALTGISTDVTERKKAEQQVQESEANLMRAQQIAHVGDWQLDIRTMQFQGSLEARRIYGFDGGAWDVQDVINAPLPQYRQRMDDALAGLVERGEEYNLEFEIRRASDGETRYVHSVAEFDAGRQIVFGVIQDITERRRMEQALRASEEKYRFLIENQTDLVVRVGADNRLEFVSQSYCELFNKKEAELLGESFLPLVHEADREKTEKAMRLLHEPPYSVYIEQRAMTRYGWRWLGWMDTAVLDDDGNVQAVIGVGRDITERKQMERALQESERRFRSLLEQLDIIPVQGYDADRRVNYWNKASEQVYGYTRAEALGQRLEELIIPEQMRDGVVAAVRAWMDGGPAIPAEELVLHNKDGDPVPVYSMHIMHTTQAGSKEMFCVDVDLRKVREMEQRVREDEARLRQIIDLVPHFIFAKDREGRFILANKAVAEAYGCSVRELIGKSDADFSPRDAELEHFRGDDLRVIDSGEALFIPEEKITDARGNVRYLQTQKIPLTVAYSGERAVLGVSVDITKVKRATEELAESERRYRQLAQNFPDGVIFLIDKNLNHIFCDGRELAGAGLTKEDIIGKNVRDVWTPEMLEEIIPANQKALQGESTRFEVTFKGRIYDNHAIPLVKDDGSIDEAIVVTMNISERKRAEEERLRLEEQLRQSQKMEALGVLAGGIAHDFNNILFGIIGYADLLGLEVEGNADAEEYLEGIIANGERAAGLVKQILTFARKTERHRSSIDIVPLCKETLKLLRSTIPASVELRTDISVPHAIVSSDPTEIHQVLMNLCTNAAQAVDESGGRIEVSLDDWHSGGGSSGAEQSPQYYYRLRVRDNGPGIDEDVIERIFDPFFTTKGVGEGTGMGLAVVHSIAEQLGGLVEAGNNEGGPGACMTVYLPTDGGGASAEGQKRAKPGGLPRGSERVLVVDDEPAIGRILERMLTGLGYKVTACTSSADALGKFTAAPGLFDIVITDQSMPDLSGTELLGRLRALREDIPVVVMTGFSRQLAEAGPGQLGFNALLGKPVSRDGLAHTIRDVLDGRGSSA